MKSIHELHEQCCDMFEKIEHYRPTPSEINDGQCIDWAVYVSEHLADANIYCQIWRYDCWHLFIKIEDRFFDAECLDGVIDHMDMPYFQRLSKERITISLDSINQHWLSKRYEPNSITRD